MIQTSEVSKILCPSLLEVSSEKVLWEWTVRSVLWAGSVIETPTSKWPFHATLCMKPVRIQNRNFSCSVMRNS